jgi:poly-gamma-glutamate synthesis protein (capsule biosynthesis protein)
MQDTVAPALQEVVMRFGGDCLLAEHYERAVGKDVARAFRNFDLLSTADIALVNLESPVTTRGTRIAKPFNFRTHPTFLEALTHGGIDIVNIANNHIYDYDSTGLYDTIAWLDSAGIRHVGAGRHRKEAHRPVVVDISGRRIGFLGYYGGRESPAATDHRPGVAARRIDRIRADMLSLQSRDSADYIVVNLHWGTEKADTPDAWQVRLAHEIVDAGANAVIGHHSHVLQGIEVYKSGVIAYSLGNLIFGGKNTSDYTTGIFEIALRASGPAYRLIPVRVSHWQASVMTGEAADNLLESIRRLSSVFPNSIFHKKEQK